MARLADGTEVAGRAMVAATGAHYRRLPVADLERFESIGVYYAATELEARACAGSPVVVVGGGNSAGQAAMFLAQAGSEVHVVVRRDLAATMSSYLVDRIHSHPLVQVHTGCDGDGAGRRARARAASRSPTPAGASDGAAVRGAVLVHRRHPQQRVAGGRGHRRRRASCSPTARSTRARWARRWTAINRRPLPYETSRPGLFAVGDLRAGSMKRVAAAVGEGSAAIRSVHEHLAQVPDT